MGIGELLDAAIKLYQANWQVLISIVAVIVVPITLLTLAFVESGNLILVVAAGLINAVILGPLLSAAIVKASADIYLGRDADIASSYRFATGRLVPVLLASLLVGLGVLFGLILLIVPGVILYGVWYVTTPAIVAEDLGAVDGMQRSRALTSGHLGRIIGLAIVTFLLVIVASFVISLPFTFGGFVGNAIGEILAAVLVQPFAALIPVLAYYDLRIRKEGFDLEVLARTTQDDTPTW